MNTHYGTAQVTAITLKDAIWRTLAFLGSDEPFAVLEVQCADAAGELVDADYSLMWVCSEPESPSSITDNKTERDHLHPILLMQPGQPRPTWFLWMESCPRFLRDPSG